METVKNSQKYSNVSFSKGNLLNFQGDVIICPCFTELTLINKSGLLKSLVNKAGNDLLKELCTTGYCNIGNVVITKGYNLAVKNIIFMPYIDRPESEIITYTSLHEAIRNAFDLAVLYGLKKIATVPTPLNSITNSNSKKWLAWFGYENTSRKLTSNESVDILTGLFKGYKNQIDELIVYKNTCS